MQLKKAERQARHLVGELSASIGGYLSKPSKAVSPQTVIPVAAESSLMNGRQVSTLDEARSNDRKVEGFRASSDVRKSYMQEPAVGSLCAMGISDFGGAIAVH